MAQQTDVLQYLVSKQLHPKRAGAREVHMPCMFHGEDPGKRGRLYVNIDPGSKIPGAYCCKVCGAKGNIITLMRHFGDDPAGKVDEDSLDRYEILELATAYYTKQLKLRPDVVDWLKGPERMLTSESLNKFRLGYAPRAADPSTGDLLPQTRGLYTYLKELGYEPKQILATGLCVERKDRIVDSLDGMVVIPYQVAGNIADLRGRTWPDVDDRPKYKTVSGGDTRLFNTDALWGTEEVVATEGEFDAMVMDQLGFPAVGVPGADAWQDQWGDYFTPLKRVWMVFDRDQAGEKGAAKLVEKIGPKVRPIHLSEEGIKCDPTMWVEQGNTAEDFTALLSKASKGNLLVTVREARDEFDVVQGTPGLQFGWEAFDIMIEPGLQPAQLMIFLAKTNTGKTLLLLNIMDRMRRVPGQEDMKFLFISLEQTRGEWWDRIRRIHRFYDLEATEDDCFEWWNDNIYLVDRNRLSEREVMTAIEDFEYQTRGKPNLMCLDYLGYWARGFRGDAYERSSEAVMALKGVLKQALIPGICPSQVNRGAEDGVEFGIDKARESGIIEDTADFGITVWNPDNQLGKSEEEKRGLLEARMGKSRHGGKGMKFELQFAPLSLAMVPEGDRLCARARKEVTWRRDFHDNWEKAVYRHLTGYDKHLDHVPALAERLELSAYEEGAFQMEQRRYR